MRGALLAALVMPALATGAAASDWSSLNLSSAREALLRGLTEGSGAYGFASAAKTLTEGPFDPNVSDAKRRYAYSRAANNILQVHRFVKESPGAVDIIRVEIDSALKELEVSDDSVRRKARRLYGVDSP